MFTWKKLFNDVYFNENKDSNGYHAYTFRIR